MHGSIRVHVRVFVFACVCVCVCTRVCKCQIAATHPRGFKMTAQHTHMHKFSSAPRQRCLNAAAPDLQPNLLA